MSVAPALFRWLFCFFISFVRYFITRVPEKMHFFLLLLINIVVLVSIITTVAASMDYVHYPVI